MRRTAGDMAGRSGSSPPISNQGGCLRQADQSADVKTSILKARRVPCICPKQFIEVTGGCGQAVSFSDSRGITIERVRCDSCWRTWKRINA
jgi:hypothetical protein